MSNPPTATGTYCLNGKGTSGADYQTCWPLLKSIRPEQVAVRKNPVAFSVVRVEFCELFFFGCSDRANEKPHCTNAGVSRN
jgi:hypothetical protein